MEKNNNDPEVTETASLSMQVCVPKDWTDIQVKAFADFENPCGTDQGWKIREQGHPDLDGMDERVICHSRTGFVHIMLDA